MTTPDGPEGLRARPGRGGRGGSPTPGESPCGDHTDPVDTSTQGTRTEAGWTKVDEKEWTERKMGRDRGKERSL